MNNDKVRAEFEKWAANRFGVIRLGMGMGFYSVDSIEQAWQAWQASRAALVVELPVSVCRTHVFEIPWTSEVGMEHDEYYEIEDVKSALDAAGVAYK